MIQYFRYYLVDVHKPTLGLINERFLASRQSCSFFFFFFFCKIGFELQAFGLQSRHSTS
jgi:hypothetical protein